MISGIYIHQCHIYTSMSFYLRNEINMFNIKKYNLILLSTVLLLLLIAILVGVKYIFCGSKGWESG